MIEQILEAKIAGVLEYELSALHLGIQVMGAWQPTSNDEIKSAEDGSSTGYLTIRMLPRSYDTPTIPTAQFTCQISLVMRADADVDGKGYLAATNVVSDVLQQWQDDLTQVATNLSIRNKLDVTGFQIAGGDVSSDKQNKVWTYTQSIIVYGVVLSK